jgi:hypothetical protein
VPEVDVHSFAAEWRVRAERLRAWGADAAAVVWEKAAAELEAAVAAGAADVLTLAEAGAESGYSPEHRARLVREGKIPNVGRLHAPRVRRSDLPRKPAAALHAAPAVGISRVQVAPSVLSGSRRDDD